MEREPTEEAFVETPFAAQGEAVPRGVAPFWGGPFRWLVLAHGFSGLAFWGFFATVFAEAAYRFDADASRMAVLGAALSVPFILGSLLQGLVVDRWSPKWLCFLGYVGILAAIPIAWFAASLGWLYVSAFLVGGAFATIEPSRSALTGLLVDESYLVRANGTIAIAFQLSMVLGALGSGTLYVAAGPNAVYAAATAVSLLPTLLMLAVPDARQRGERPGFSFADLRAGATTSWRRRELRILLLVTASGWMLINVFFVLEPLFVRTTLHRGGEALLFLWAAHGAGGLAGAVAMVRSRHGTGREAALVCSGVGLIGAGIAIYAGVGEYRVALLASAISGIGIALLFPPLLAFIQRVVPEERRGRVTGVFVGTQEAMGLVSSLSILVLGSLIVVRPTLFASGLAILALGLLGLRALTRSQEDRTDERAAA